MIEARQLEGNNINPVVRVTIGNKRRNTSVRQSTNKPYYNQVTVQPKFREDQYFGFLIFIVRNMCGSRKKPRRSLFAYA